jgi:hypothetical protein
MAHQRQDLSRVDTPSYAPEDVLEAAPVRPHVRRKGHLRRCQGVLGSELHLVLHILKLRLLANI